MKKQVHVLHFLTGNSKGLVQWEFNQPKKLQNETWGTNAVIIIIIIINRKLQQVRSLKQFRSKTWAKIII